MRIEIKKLSEPTGAAESISPSKLTVPAATVATTCSNHKEVPQILSKMPLDDWAGSITTFDGFTNTAPSGEFMDIGWSEMVNLLCPENPAVLADKRQGQYFVPCLLKEAPLVGNTREAAIKKGLPITGKMRSKSHVTKAELIVIDVDGLTESDFMAGLVRIKEMGLSYLAFTTFSHGSEEKPGVRARLAFPTDRRMTIEEYAYAWHGLDSLFWSGKAGQSDGSGANMYQQQGTWACHPSRIGEADTWKFNGGVVSTNELIAFGKVASGGALCLAVKKIESESLRAPSSIDGIDIGSNIKYPPSDANKIADQCAQIRAFRDEKGAGQSEPLWRDCLGVTGHCLNGKEISHNWSSGHVSYTKSETDEKLANRLKTPPTTCDQFKKSNPSGCEGCTLGCRSPITLGQTQEKFQVVETAPIETVPPKAVTNVLDQYSLRGQSAEIERQAVDEVLILGQLALWGQITFWFAAPNVGKTLLLLFLLIEAIRNKRINPADVYYINVDDSSRGLAEKAAIADEFGFHMLAEGYRDFSAGAFQEILVALVQKEQARGKILLLDTLKKFVDLMDKSKSRQFLKLLRQFVLKGGTVIALAHTNKNPGRNGKPVYGGTSDTVDDCDCSYMLTVAESGSSSTEKVVRFENIKRRGNVVSESAYSYCAGSNVSYSEILSSVQQRDEQRFFPMKQAVQIRSDAEVVVEVKACIAAGTNTKMKLAESVSKAAAVSKRTAIQIIERYTGDNPEMHEWQFSVGERGAKVYTLLSSAVANHSLEKSVS